MTEIQLTVPEPIVDSLPADGDDVAHDMERAVAGWERRLNTLLHDSDDASPVVDVIERFEDRWQRYDSFIVELRAWGQSPIYAMAWRDLHESLIQQLYDHDSLADVIDRERHARLVEDGIRHR